jgi:xanthine dehydrogenase small subunit
MRDYVLLYVNGRRTEVRGEHVLAPLSSYLRYVLNHTGTKVVCAEGDCGACAVLVGRVQNGRLKYQPITSCIAIVGQMDCTHVITVEGLTGNGRSSALQESMVTHHGAQCGFCTPGFVVSLCALLDETREPGERQVRDALVGNLCRCTGYESILTAARAVDAQQMRSLDELYPPGPILSDLQAAPEDEPLLQFDGRSFYQPRTIESAATFKSQHPNCTVLAGGTDIGVQVNKGTRSCDAVLSVSAIADFARMDINDDAIVAGGGATLTDLERATKDTFAEFHQMLARHGSPLIRNAGTLAGNIANGSPIADALPALYVLDGEIELTGSSGVRRININHFYTGYKRTVMTADELITAVHIPRPQNGEILRLYKVSKRFDVDISTFTAAIWLKLDGPAIADVRIACGGVGPNILRLPRSEALLRGHSIDEELFHRAGLLARSEITPISDVRGSADYRYQLAQNILLKFYFELPSSLVPLESVVE